MFGQLNQRSVSINNRDVDITWTQAAQRALQRRERILYVEMELYFSCLVKKFVHFRDAPRGLLAPSVVSDRLQVYFRPVTSTACSMEEAEKLGRQPETDIALERALRLAPKSLALDFRGGQWTGQFRL